MDDNHSHFSDSSGSNNSAINTFLGTTGLGYYHSSNSNNYTPHNGIGNGGMIVEPEYKTLTVFKTCEDYEGDEDHPSNEYEFEFIEVVEPEVPVPTRDACFQVRLKSLIILLLTHSLLYVI
jgi:hypothetical protein